MAKAMGESRGCTDAVGLCMDSGSEPLPYSAHGKELFDSLM